MPLGVSIKLAGMLANPAEAIALLHRHGLTLKEAQATVTQVALGEEQLVYLPLVYSLVEVTDTYRRLGMAVARSAEALRNYGRVTFRMEHDTRPTAQQLAAQRAEITRTLKDSDPKGEIADVKTGMKNGKYVVIVTCRNAPNLQAALREAGGFHAGQSPWN